MKLFQRQISQLNLSSVKFRLYTKYQISHFTPFRFRFHILTLLASDCTINSSTIRYQHLTLLVSAAVIFTVCFSLLLMAIAVLFAICWFPLTLLNLLADINYFFFMHHNFLLVFATAHLVAMFSACINPIVYGWFNSNFRREFLRKVSF